MKSCYEGLQRRGIPINGGHNPDDESGKKAKEYEKK